MTATDNGMKIYLKEHICCHEIVREMGILLQWEYSFKNSLGLEFCAPLVVEIQEGIDKRFGSIMNNKKYLLASMTLCYYCPELTEGKCTRISSRGS